MRRLRIGAGSAFLGYAVVHVVLAVVAIRLGLGSGILSWLLVIPAYTVLVLGPAVGAWPGPFAPREEEVGYRDGVWWDDNVGGE